MKQTPAGKPLPPMADMWYRLRRNRAAMFGLGMIVIFILAALAGIVFIDDAAVFETNPDALLQSPSI